MRTNSTLKKAVKFVNNCKFIFSFKKNIFQKNIFSILLSLFATISFSQTQNVDSYLANLQASGPEADFVHFKHLLYDLQSASYYFSSEASVKTYGDNPTALFVDINSLASIATQSIPDTDIEIVTIKIESNSDLIKKIDLAAFSGFSKLKYIYITSDVPTSEAALNNMIKNDTSKYVLVYTISIGG
jgi:hypothetical protein